MKKLFTILALSVSFAASAQVVISGKMDNWHNYTSGIFPPTQLEIADGWHGSDSLACFFGPFLDPTGTFVKQIFKSTDKQSGPFAARIVTKEQGSFGALPAVLSNASMTLDTTGGGVNVTFFGGTPVTQRLDYANAWVKYTPATVGEEAHMMVEAVLSGMGANGDSVIGYGDQLIPATSAYYAASVNIVYTTTTVVPDKVRVIFYSSSPDGSVFTDGSELFVDEVTVSLFPVEVKRVFDYQQAVNVFPSIGNGIVKMETTSDAPMQLQVYSANGQLVSQKSFAGNTVADLSMLADGLYVYTILSNNNVLQRGKLSIVK